MTTWINYFISFKSFTKYIVRLPKYIKFLLVYFYTNRHCTIQLNDRGGGADSQHHLHTVTRIRFKTSLNSTFQSFPWHVLSYRTRPVWEHTFIYMLQNGRKYNSAYWKKLIFISIQENIIMWPENKKSKDSKEWLKWVESFWGSYLSFMFNFNVTVVKV